MTLAGFKPAIPVSKRPQTYAADGAATDIGLVENLLPYFLAHKRHRDFSLGVLENNDEYILILVIYWKKTEFLHTKIRNHNIIYSS